MTLSLYYSKHDNPEIGRECIASDVYVCEEDRQPENTARCTICDTIVRICQTCVRILTEDRGFGPSHIGSARCESGSINSGGNKAHCSCDVCF